MKRRNFLSGLMGAMAVPSVVNGFAVDPVERSAFLDALMGYSMNNDRVLVIVQLIGGNDGLNTIIPLSNYSGYFNARSNIAIPESKVLALAGRKDIGFHPVMKGMQSLFNDGKLNIIQSVGYPNPNFSHFRSTDIWMSASDSDKLVTSGWAGRFLTEAYPGFPANYPNATMPDPPAVKIGSLSSLALQGPMANLGMSISSTNSFYNIVNGVEDPAPATPAGQSLTYIRTVAKQTQQYFGSIKTAVSKVAQQVEYPANNPLGEQLKIVARLIAGGLKTRVYFTTIGGFDTHSMQVSSQDPTVGAHAKLLQTLSDAVKAFMDDCKQLGVDDRVAGMTFSEFGRRIRSNSSLGTDHGAAAPMFVFGNHVNAGMVGTNPEIRANVSAEDNIPYQYDYRSVYGSIMENWFCATPNTVQTVLFRNYQSLPVFKAGTCTSGSAGVSDPFNDPLARPDTTVKPLVQVGPNPVVDSMNIRFTAKTGNVLMQLLDTTGRQLATVVDGEYGDGTFNVSYNAGRLPSGVYYLRFQNGTALQVKSVLKA